MKARQADAPCRSLVDACQSFDPESDHKQRPYGTDMTSRTSQDMSVIRWQVPFLVGTLAGASAWAVWSPSAPSFDLETLPTPADRVLAEYAPASFRQLAGFSRHDVANLVQRRPCKRPAVTCDRQCHDQNQQPSGGSKS